MICKHERACIGADHPYLRAKDSSILSTSGIGSSATKTKTKTKMISSKTWKIGTTGVIPYTTSYEKAQHPVGLFLFKKDKN